VKKQIQSDEDPFAAPVKKQIQNDDPFAAPTKKRIQSDEDPFAAPVKKQIQNEDPFAAPKTDPSGEEYSDEYEDDCRCGGFGGSLRLRL
jgi:hypothetical protein